MSDFLKQKQWCETRFGMMVEDFPEEILDISKPQLMQFKVPPPQKKKKRKNIA